ncbi:hypothetical protein BaRGS_00021322 [Batillaria attramentaria]|uniref:Uncharacterized protein n=1 Tax=Batillaria attramentaria TaxID=370345 RepID=A0ABD0KJT9_9CAEN
MDDRRFTVCVSITAIVPNEGHRMLLGRRSNGHAELSDPNLRRFHTGATDNVWCDPLLLYLRLRCQDSMSTRLCKPSRTESAGSIAVALAGETGEWRRQVSGLSV